MSLVKPLSASCWTFYEAYQCYTIEGRECTIWVTARPAYCDRGNWWAQLEARGQLALDIDRQDGWPRYYFDFDRAKAECEAWLVKRKQWIDSSGSTPQG